MKVRNFFIIVAFIIIFLCSCSKSSIAEQNIRLISEESFFDDFSVVNDKVHMECSLTVENLTSKEVAVKINASSKEDAGGLLKSPNMKGFNSDLSSDTFTLSSGKNSITVIFIGDFGGKKQKKDRLPPENITFETAK